MLSACGGGTDISGAGSTQEPSINSSESRPSLSAAQLAGDSSSGVQAALASEGVEEESNNSVPEIGAANPDSGNNLTEIPETGSNQSPDSTPDSAETESAEIDSESAEEINRENASTDEQSGQGQQQFSSVSTAGFQGEVLDDSLRITWQSDPDARGYNVYRDSDYITSVFTEEYIDNDVYDGSYYYEIEAFDYAEPSNLYRVATGLTVKPSSFGRTDPDAPSANADLLQDYELIFSDEFNGSSLDTSKWNTEFIWGDDLLINNEEQYYVDIKNDPDFGFNPFSFDGEHMTITTIETPPELAHKAKARASYNGDLQEQPYLSGLITSRDALSTVYGYYEIRAKFTHGRGYWPAFWLLNTYYVDAKPEIDIMEFIGHNQDVVYHTYHYFDSDGNLRSTESMPTTGIDFTSDFHTFGVEWNPGELIFYVDSVEVHRVIDSNVSQQEMYILANTAVGGWWAGPPDSSTPFPGEYKIDYIRAYQKITPYNDVIQDDGTQRIPLADANPGTSSPNHRPTKELWPEGYPDGT